MIKSDLSINLSDRIQTGRYWIAFTPLLVLFSIPLYWKRTDKIKCWNSDI